MFVGTRDVSHVTSFSIDLLQGIIWYVNLDTGVKTIFTDISAEVGLSGDRGLMDVVTHPNYVNVLQILVQFTTDPNMNDGVEPDAEAAANQKVIRLQDLGGES